MPALIQKDAGFVRLPRDRLLPSLPARYSPGGRYRRALLSATLDASGCNTVGITLAFTLQIPFFFLRNTGDLRGNPAAPLSPRWRRSVTLAKAFELE